jgi:hypothetical protein
MENLEALMKDVPGKNLHDFVEKSIPENFTQER